MRRLQHIGRIVEFRVIEQIERLGKDLYDYAFGNRQILGQSQIEIPALLAQNTRSAAPSIDANQRRTEIVIDRSRVRPVKIETRPSVRHVASRADQPVVYGDKPHAGAVLQAHIAQWNSLATGAQDIAIYSSAKLLFGAVVHGIRRAGSVGENRRNNPAADDPVDPTVIARPALALAEWKVPGSQQIGGKLPVEILETVIHARIVWIIRAPAYKTG